MKKRKQEAPVSTDEPSDVTPASFAGSPSATLLDEGRGTRFSLLRSTLSAFGTKRTSQSRSAMSAFGGKADIDQHALMSPHECKHTFNESLAGRLQSIRGSAN
jgi:hypothetical protein